MADRITAEPGSVSTGTCNSEHLLPILANELESNVTAQSPDWIRENEAEVRSYDKLIQEAHALASRLNDADCDDIDGCEIDGLLTDLFDAIDEFAPEGTTFCSHPGDATDFGYWVPEGCEYDLEDADEEWLNRLEAEDEAAEAEDRD